MTTMQEAVELRGMYRHTAHVIKSLFLVLREKPLGIRARKETPCCDQCSEVIMRCALERNDSRVALFFSKEEKRRALERDGTIVITFIEDGNNPILLSGVYKLVLKMLTKGKIPFTLPKDKPNELRANQLRIGPVTLTQSWNSYQPFLQAASHGVSHE